MFFIPTGKRFHLLSGGWIGFIPVVEALFVCQPEQHHIIGLPMAALTHQALVVENGHVIVIGESFKERIDEAPSHINE